MGRSQSVCPDGQFQPSEQASQDKERYLSLSVGCLSLEYTNRVVSSAHKPSRNLGRHVRVGGTRAAAAVVLRAQEKWRSYGFTTISLVQCDNGPEFGRHFAQELERAGIQLRHNRLGRPNDNAHIERFNRTLQEECIGHYWRRSVPLPRQREKLSRYIDFYNNKRIHLGIQMRTPAEMLQRW